MHDKDCYIFLDMNNSIPEEQQKPVFLCQACRDSLRPDEGWFWPGETGYGPWDFKCNACGIYLHKHNKGTNEKNSTAI